MSKRSISVTLQKGRNIYIILTEDGRTKLFSTGVKVDHPDDFDRQTTNQTWIRKRVAGFSTKNKDIKKKLEEVYKLTKDYNSIGVQFINTQIASEWHPVSNENLTPYNVTAVSDKSVSWLCT